MSNIDELIQKYCPNGVKYKSLEEISEFRRGSFPQPYGDIKWYGGKDSMPFVQVADVAEKGLQLNEKTNQLISVLAQPKSIFVPKGTVIVSIQGSIGRVAITQYDSYVDRTLAIFYSYKITIDKRYFAYQLEYKFEIEKQFARGSTLKTITKDEFKKFKIPVPPLEIQQEIVRILDSFTTLTTELTTKLTTELTARKKQYEYYRDMLLTFEKANQVELESIILSLNTGLNPRKFFKLNTDDAKNYYVTIRELQNNTIVFSEKTDKINDEAMKLCNNRSNLEIGDILFSGTGTIGETALISEQPKNWNIKEGIYVIKPKKELLNSKFLMYILKTQKVRDDIMKKVAGGTVKSIPMAEMKKLKISLPPIEQQQKIVSILDRFNALYNDITTGLLAEIEARKKQYEYYRDKLLTFQKTTEV